MTESKGVRLRPADVMDHLERIEDRLSQIAGEVIARLEAIEAAIGVPTPMPVKAAEPQPAIEWPDEANP